MRLLALIITLLALSPWSAHADITDSLRAGETATVLSVVDGDTVILSEAVRGATDVRLVGIQAPKLPLGRRNFKQWPLSPESKVALEKLTLGKQVRLYYGGADMDRHGRLLAHLVRDDGLWVQGEMLSLGMARVYTFPDNRSITSDMYAREQKARRNKAGIWAHPYYTVRTATDSLNKRIGTFQVIEGYVRDVAKVKGMVYLNFGDDWRSDFTISIRSRTGKLFKKAQIDLLALKDRNIRTRGWLKKRNGPMIELSHPEQLEILSD